MDNKTCINNYLLVLKSTTEVYVHGTLESSNQDIRDLLKSGLDETMHHQALTYDKMVKYGWYNVSNVDPNIINEILIKVNNN